jgi:hypothetical protein
VGVGRAPQAQLSTVAAPRHRRRWRSVLAAAVILSVAVLLGATARSASAAAPYVDGIADQNLGQWQGGFADNLGVFGGSFTTYFQQAWVGAPASHILYARFVTAPDVIAQGGACEQNLFNWYEYVTQTAHLIPVIAVWDVAEGGCADHGAPSNSKYTTDVEQLLGALAGLGTQLPDLEAWNEPNESGVSASTAAGYWRDASSVCATSGCTALAGDMVDAPDQSGQKFDPGCTANLTFNNLKSYEVSYVKALGGAAPAIWAFHPYLAVNCEQEGSLRTFAANLPAASTPPQIWFTEVASYECYNGQSPPRGAARQQADASYLVNTLMGPGAPAAPTNVFWYELAANGFTQNCAKYSDSALYEASAIGDPLLGRPAAQTVYGPDTELSATTDAATAVGTTQATLNGSEVPGGIYEGSYSFQYGPAPTSLTYQTATVALGPGLSAEPVSTTITGLSPGTPYYFRLAATDTNGLTVYGGAVPFTTSPSVPVAAPPPPPPPPPTRRTSPGARFGVLAH